MAKKTKSKKSKSSNSQSSAPQFTSGSDVVDGTSKNDKFKAGDGADLVNGLGGNDKLYGGDGDDTLNGGDGKDQLKGDAGDDSLDGGAGNDKLWGGDGEDLLQGGAGNDDLKGDKGNDTLMGGAGNDKLKGGAGDDVMSGGDGNDDLKGGDGNDQMSGDAGDDKMSGGAGDDVMLGGDGDDVMSGDGSGSGSGDVASFNDYLDGGTGNDWIQGNQGDDTVLGGEGDDVVIGDSFGSGSHFGKGSGSGSGSGDLWADSVQPHAKGSGSGSGGGKKGKGSGSGSGSGKGSGSGSGSGDVSNATFNDYLDGGAGNDIVLGMQGDDEARYGVTENAGASDKYAGGRGIDTLTLDMTHDEWFRADIQQDIADYLAFLAANTDPVTGEANSNEFQFQAFDLIAREFENLRVFVDGVEIDPTDHTPVAVDDSGDVLEDDAAIAFGTVLANDDVQDLVQSITLVSGPAEGVLDFVEGTGGVQDGNGTLDQIGGRTVGSFTFDPNDDFEDLAVGETRDVSFIYEVTDADGDTTQATVTITVTGQNDAPVISVGDSVLSGGVTEHADLSASENATSHNASGQVTFSDVDVSDTHTASFAANGTGYRGAFSVATPTSTSATTDGQIGWSFDIADADIDDLAAGQVLTQSYDVTVDDGNGGTDTTTVTVTITGTNDAPIFDSAAVDVALSESVAPASLNASGAITFSDVDTLDSHVVTRGPLTVSGEYLGQPVPLDPEGIRPEDVALLEAALVVDSDGNWSFDVPVTDQIERLAEGMSITLTSLVTVTDDSGAANDSDTQLLTISITGTNDAPEILSSVTSGAVTEIADLAAGENSDTLSTAGTIAFRDIDQANVHTVSVAENGTGYRGGMSAAVTSATQGFGNQDSGVVDWQFDIADADIDDLAAGQTLTQSYTLTITDNDGGSTTETVTVTITGTNDAPVIETAPVDVTLTEGIAPTALSSSGVVTFSDVDTLDSHIVTRGPVTVSGTYQGQPVPFGPEGLRPEDIAMAEAALVVNADGSWTFDMPASELVDRMAEG
jgi:VCBS repeat-containing protein